jgi:hypothetical protein
MRHGSGPQSIMIQVQSIWDGQRSSMAILIIIALAVVAGSIYADYRWRRWVDARRRERQ